MGKTDLTLEDIEQIQKSKGLLSASEVRRKYNIGWERPKKLWGNGEKDTQIVKASDITAKRSEVSTEKEEAIGPEDLLGPNMEKTCCGGLLCQVYRYANTNGETIEGDTTLD